MGGQRLWTMCCNCRRQCRVATRPGIVVVADVVVDVVVDVIVDVMVVVVFVLAMQGGHQARYNCRC